MKRSAKRLFLSILTVTVTVVMMTLSFSFTSGAASTHSHPVCGSSCQCSSDSHGSRTWTAWDGTTKMYNGNYYLTKNVVLSSTMILDYSYSSSLCLNGYSITCEDMVFDIYSYRSLLITDCKGTGKVESTDSYYTIGNNRYLSIWGGNIINSQSYGSAILACSNTTTYVCGGNIKANGETIYTRSNAYVDIRSGKIESTRSDAIYALPTSHVEIHGGEIKGYYSAYSGHGLTDAAAGDLIVTGGTMSSEAYGVLDVQWANFTMTGGTVDGDVFVSHEDTTTTVSGGTMGELLSYSDTINITGGTMSPHLYAKNLNIAAGTFLETAMIRADNAVISGGDFTDCSTLYLNENGSTWIYGGYFSKITVFSPLYISGVPEIETLWVMKPDLVSAQNPDLTGSYGGEPIEVFLDNAQTTWKDGNVVIKNVRNDSVAQKFFYNGYDDARWVSFERSNNNLVLDMLPHGTCGAGVKWGIEGDTLYIYGSGSVTYNYSGSQYPWWPYVDDIKHIVVEEGITGIPAYTFEYCENAETISLPETLLSVHISAFNDCGSLNNLLLPSSLTQISYYNCYINRCESLTDLYYLGTEEELSALLKGSTLTNWGGNPVLTVHCLELREGTSATCTEPGVAAYYQFDDTSVYGGMYDTDKNLISAPEAEPALGHLFTNYVSNMDATYYENGTKTATCDRCDATETITDPGTKIAPVSISLLTTPDKLSYITNEKLVLDGLTFVAQYSNGDSVIFSAKDIESVSASMDATGKQTVTISYMGCSAEFQVGVHPRNVVTVDSSYYPESQHSYASNINQSKTFYWEGAKSLEITFSASTMTENNYDFIYLYDDAGALIGKYTGSAAAGITVKIEGHGFTITLTSDHSVQKYGYSFTSIVATMGDMMHPPVTDAAIEPTCTEEGKTQGSHCEICDMVIMAQEPVDALGHDEVTHEGQDATCTDFGWSEYMTCSRCDYTTYEEIDALGHDEISHVGQDATCTDLGWSEYVTCSRCDYTTYDEIDALGHDEIYHEAKDATCTDIGWNEHVSCSRCDYTTCEEISSLGHDEVTHEGQDATCTDFGWSEYVTCSRCDYTTYEEIDALGHDEITHEGQDATCTDFGWNEYVICGRCDYTTYEEIDALGHDEIFHEAKDATCTDIGWNDYISCSRCDYTTISVKQPLGHSFVDGVCETCGFEHHGWSEDPDGGEFILGDINGDGFINAVDANILKRIIAGTMPSGAENIPLFVLDISGDGLVNALDSNLLKRIIAGTR